MGHFESRILHISPILFLFVENRFGEEKELKLYQARHSIAEILKMAKLPKLKQEGLKLFPCLF